MRFIFLLALNLQSRNWTLRLNLEKMSKFETDRRSGEERRQYNYAIHIPERRSGKDRRIARNGKKVPWIKISDESNKLKISNKMCLKKLLP